MTPETSGYQPCPLGILRSEVTTMGPDLPAWAQTLISAREAHSWDIPDAADLLWQRLNRSIQRDSARRMIANWECGRHRPRGRNLLAYCAVLGIDPRDLEIDTETGPAETTDLLATLQRDAVDLAAWTEQTNVGDMTIDYLADAARRVAVDYQVRAPLPVLTEAAGHQRRVAELLRGHQHLRQTRDLYLISGQILALLSWASSDLGQPGSAEAYSRAGGVMAEQADHDDLRALILITRSKTAYWERRLSEAAEHAARGFALAGSNSARVLLACQLGDAYQAMGDVPRAVEAHQSAQRARDEITGADVAGIWSCGRARQANYAIAVDVRAGDPVRALEHADEARAAYAAGEPVAYGTWAQICIGAGIAHVLKGDLEGAAAELEELFGLPPERRLVTLSTRLGELDWRLRQPRYRGCRPAAELREQITHYRAHTITAHALMAGDA